MIEQQNTHIRKGLVIALIMVLLDIILQLTHQKQQPWVLYLNSGILLAGVVIAVQLRVGEAEEKIQFSNLFSYGFKASVVTVCILFLYNILSIYLLFPGAITDLYNQSVAQARKMEGFNAAKIAENKEMAIKVIRISTLSWVVMFNLAVGIAGALIGAIIKLLTGLTGIIKK